VLSFNEGRLPKWAPNQQRILTPLKVHHGWIRRKLVRVSKSKLSETLSSAYCWHGPIVDYMYDKPAYRSPAVPEHHPSPELHSLRPLLPPPDDGIANAVTAVLMTVESSPAAVNIRRQRVITLIMHTKRAAAPERAHESYIGRQILSALHVSRGIIWRYHHPEDIISTRQQNSWY
jgi:hypothetical protein